VSRTPRIAVLLDENTSSGATRYEASKGYFLGIGQAGGAPFGIPYFEEMIEGVAADFDGLLSVGGRFAYPPEWYRAGESALAPASPRLAVERGLMGAFLAAGKPVLGICAGMQALACLNGCRLTADVSQVRGALTHDARNYLHPVALARGSKLRALVGSDNLMVNSFHREAVMELAGPVIATAHAPDGVIEAIELTDHPFAIGLQWHQELFAGTDHPGNRVFDGFVAACAKG
jgi:putative glutamine amidotransferase